MAAMSNSSVTSVSVLYFDTDPTVTLAGSVLYANPTATAYLIDCPGGPGDCANYNETLTVGPWANPNPPPSATTGIYDDSVQAPGEDWTFSFHCTMSGTVPAICTTINIGGNNDGSPTSVYTSPASDDDTVGWGYVPLYITAGQEKLASVSATATSSSAVPTGASAGSTAPGSASATSASGSGSASATSATGSAAKSASGSSTAASASASASASSSSSAAARSHGPGLGSLALFGMLAAWLLI